MKCKLKILFYIFQTLIVSVEKNCSSLNLASTVYLLLQIGCCCDGMVDFFTGEPCSVDENNLKEDLGEKMLRLCRSWQRVIGDCWILGFDLVNFSEK